MSQRYLATTAAVAAGLIALAAALNFFVDPFDYFGRNTLGIYISAEREAKLTGLRQHPQDAVLLGTSKAAMVDASLLRGPAKFYNAGLGGATPEEVTALVRHVSPTAPLVVVALDFFQYSDRLPIVSSPFPPQTWQDSFNYLFNLQGVGYAWQTMLGAWRGRPPTLQKDGSFNAVLWREHHDVADPAALAALLANQETQWREFHFSPDRVNELVLLRSALENRGSPYAVVINPLQVEDLRRLRHAGMGPALEDWRARVRMVFPEAVDLLDSSYSDAKNFFKLDPVHFYPEVGAAMLNEKVLPHPVNPAKTVSPPPA